MKYAVIYQSNTGNTERIAKAIFDAIDAEDKMLVDLYDASWLPEADMYFVGFAVNNRSCSLSVMECLNNIEYGKLALFATGGFYPTVKYKEQLENNISAWINDGVEYLGMYLSQGKIVEGQKAQFIKEYPDHKSSLIDMFEIGDDHPDSDDLKDAAEFVEIVLEGL